MKITLIGMGSGCPESLTVQGYAALREADLILGARRLLSALPAGCTENRAAAYLPDEILELLHASGCENAALLYSGDTGFYSGASALVERLQAQGYQPVVLPGLSSVQMLSAALGRPWQDWKLVSAHGRACDPVAECMEGKPTFFLTGGSESPATLCAQLAAEGFGKLAAAVGENLGTPEQKVYTGTVGQLAASRFESLSVLLVEAAQVPSRRTPGPAGRSLCTGQSAYDQAGSPCRRAGKAGRPARASCCWDVGAGTGSVSVELALAAPRGRVYAVECDAGGLCASSARTRRNSRSRNLTLVEGTAPAALENLPAPDAVFIGGTKGEYGSGGGGCAGRATRRPASAFQPLRWRRCSAAVAALTAHGPDRRRSRQISVSRARAAGKLHLLMANNPIFLIPGDGELAYDRSVCWPRRTPAAARPPSPAPCWQRLKNRGYGPLCVQVRAGLHRPHVPPVGAGRGEPQSGSVLSAGRTRARALYAAACGRPRRRRRSRASWAFTTAWAA